MDQILERLERVAEKIITDFESNPVKESLKLLFFYWIFKKIWREIKR